MIKYHPSVVEDSTTAAFFESLDFDHWISTTAEDHSLHGFDEWNIHYQQVRDVDKSGVMHGIASPSAPCLPDDKNANSIVDHDDVLFGPIDDINSDVIDCEQTVSAATSSTSTDSIEPLSSVLKRKPRQQQHSKTDPSLINPQKDIITEQFKEIFQQFVQAVDSGHASHLKSLLTKHCSSDVILIMKFKSHGLCPYSNCNFLNVVGSHAVSAFLESSIVAIPDSRIGVHEVKTKICRFGLIHLTCHYAFLGTKALLLSCERGNSFIKECAPVLNIHTTNLVPSNTNNYIVTYAIEGENRHKIIESCPPLHGIITGTMNEPEELKLFGSIQLTFNPHSQLITKILISHGHKKR